MDELKSLQAMAVELREKKKKIPADSADYFLITEELLDVNERLRLLRGTHKRASLPPAKGLEASIQTDYQMFVNWDETQRSFNDDIDAGRQMEIRAVVTARAALSKKQREYLDAYASGERMTSIAKRYGVVLSSVSRTISRARANVKCMAELQIIFARGLRNEDPQEDTIRALHIAIRKKAGR